MTAEVNNQSSLPKNDISLPRNYYVNGDPVRVIDRLSNLARLDGDPKLADLRQSLAKEVLSFGPAVFIDELNRALVTSFPDNVNQEAIKALRDKASNNEISLKQNSLLSEEEKNRLSALAIETLTAKILDARDQKIISLLYFVREYINFQNRYQEMVYRQIADLEEQKETLAEEIRVKQQEFAENQKLIFFDFLKRLLNEDF